MNKYVKYKCLTYMTLFLVGKFKHRYFDEKEKKFSKPKNNFSSKVCVPPTIDDWNDLFKNFKTSEKVNSRYDIIVPVFDGFAETARCLYSVLRAKSKLKFELIVINDCSPNKDITSLLYQLSEKKLITLLTNESNLGFVKSMNLGMLLHTDRDVIWLNSDTEVFDFWIDRIINISKLDDSIATVTPVSNNATIFSYPSMGLDFAYDYLISDKQLDELCSSNFSNTFFEVPTGVGFCMYVKRSALNRCGVLDEIFGMGYVEENDLCQRFISYGFKNVVTPSTFIRHYGHVSFKTSSILRMQNNLKILISRYPFYYKDVDTWINFDPLRHCRIALDYYILKKICDIESDGKLNILFVSHNRGGGTEKFLNEHISKLNLKGINSYILIPTDKPFIGKIVTKKQDHFFNLNSIDCRLGYDDLSYFITLAKINVVHIMSLVDWSYELADSIIELRNIHKFKLFTYIHDYHWCCSNIDLHKKHYQVCLNPKDSNCKDCNIINSNKSQNIYRERKSLQNILEFSDEIFAPSFDTKKRIESFYDRINVKVIPHSENFRDLRVLKNTTESNFTICALGALNINKGSSILISLYRYLNENNIAANIKVVGYIEPTCDGIACTGAYKTNDLKRLLNDINPSIIFIPSIWPETYSYTLSEALLTGIPICCFDLGAQSERLKKIGLEYCVISQEYIENPSMILSSMKKIVGLWNWPEKEIRESFDYDNFDKFYGCCL